MVPTIRSRFFILRPFRKGDEDSLRRNINSKKIHRYTLLIPHPYIARHATEWIKKNVSLQKKKRATEINFAIDINDEVVGGVGLSRIEKHKAEIGYWLGENYWGKGIMTAAVKLALKFCFQKLKLRRVYASVHNGNKASARVLQKADFKFEGVNRRNYLKDGKLIDSMLYAKTR